MTPINKNLSCSPLQRATRLGTALILTAALGMASVAPAMADVNSSGQTVTSTTSAAQPSVVGDAIVGTVLRPEIGEGWNESVSFQWMRDGVKIQDETWYSYTVTADDLGKKISIRITGDTSKKYRDSGQTAAVTYTPILSTSAPRVTGSAVSGSKLTANTGSWDPSTVTKTYQWSADGAKIAGATASTFVLTPAQAGKKITVTVTASAALFRATSVTSIATAPVTLPTAANTAAPKITGLAAIGQVLTGSPGTWTGATSFDYQWLADGAAISGATAATYTVAPAQVDKKISLRVTGKAVGYNPRVVVSGETSPVMANAVVNTAIPVISGTAAQDSTLTATAGTWTPSGVTVAYQWYAGGQPIAGATARTFKLTAAQVGKTISVGTVGSLAGFKTASARSAETKAVLIPSVWGPAPVIAGTPEVGKTLTGTPGAWTAGSALKYQWLANGQWITGATAPTYTLTTAEVGKKITVAITGTRDGYRTYSRSSAATAAVTDLVITASTAPVMSGTHTKLSTLTVTPGTWAPGGVDVSYQWLRNGQPITGATAASFKLTAADVGQRVTVQVTGSKAGYSTGSFTAPESGPVADLYVTSTQNATLAGTSVVGYTLRVATGTWTTGTAVSYQWLRDGQWIAGATKSTYLLTAADAGKRISVAVTGTKADHVSRSTTSASTGAVSIAYVKTVTPERIDGGLHVFNRLFAVSGAWDTAGVSVTRQWLRNGTAIPGATGAYYDLTSADVGATITVKTTAGKASYRSVTNVSAPTGVIKRAQILSTGAPVLLGSSRAGSNMGVSAGSWNVDKLTLKYQWYANGVAINGAVYNTYSTSLSQLGKTITVKVTASRSGYLTATAMTAGSAPVTK